MQKTAQLIVQGLGGADNIESILPCSTRLRIEVVDPGRIQEGIIRSADVLAVLRSGRVVQVVIGPEADEIAELIGELS